MVKNQMEYHTVIRETPTIEVAEKSVAVPQVEVREVIQEVSQVVVVEVARQVPNVEYKKVVRKIAQTCLLGLRKDHRRATNLVVIMFASGQWKFLRSL